MNNLYANIFRDNYTAFPMEKITITLFTPTANTDDGIKTINYVENRLKPERPTSASELRIYIKNYFILR